MFRLGLQEAIGQGAFATVLRCSMKDSPEFFACKVYRQKAASWVDACEMSEIQALLAVHGKPHIMQLIEFGREDDDTLYFLSRLEEGSLYELLQREKALDENVTKSVMRQVLLGLSALHNAGYIHRDIKPENILVSTRKVSSGEIVYEIVLGDLGSCVLADNIQGSDHYVTTRFYRSPEFIFRLSKYSAKVDMWSIGCVCFEILAGKPLFPAQGESDLMLRMCAVLGSPPLDQGRYSNYRSGYLDGLHIPAGFKKQPLRRWFQATLHEMPSANLISFLEALLAWHPDDRVDCKGALERTPFVAFC